jgi:predicted Zn finger-like uncharacterized protein
MKLLCPRCHGTHTIKDGHLSPTDQRYRCRSCQRTFTERTGTAFAGYRFPADVILMAVRWYTLDRLSAANVRDLLAERGIDVSDRSVLSWVHIVGPPLAAAACHHGRRTGHRWYADETYVRVRGRWAYLYRAVHEGGQVVDVRFREHRDLDSARAFFIQLYRAAGHETTKPIESSPVPITDRRRSMRGRQSIATGQRLLEGRTVAQAIRRGDVTMAGCAPPATPHQRARHVAIIVQHWAAELRLAG